MNTKFIAIGTACFGYGVVIGWAITADRAERKARRMAEDFASMENTYREKSRQTATLELELEEVRLDLEKVEILLASALNKEPFVEEINTGGEVQEVAYDEVPPGESVEETRANLQAKIDEYTGNSEDAIYVGEMVRKTVESTKFEPPVVISKATWAWDELEEGDEYAKHTITYYSNERVLLDEEGEVVPQSDIEHMVGWRNLQRFGDESGDVDTVYIRNRRLETDFEVVRETEEELPPHVRFGMPKDVFETRLSAGRIKFREEDV